VVFEGHECSFCCAGCRAEFLRDPGAYTKKESRC
jgi:YHS domain-containing protein